MTAFGIVLLVALILVGALLPLKYTARMHLPKREAEPRVRGDERHRNRECPLPGSQQCRQEAGNLPGD